MPVILDEGISRKICHESRKTRLVFFYTLLGCMDGVEGTAKDRKKEAGGHQQIKKAFGGLPPGEIRYFKEM
ncbi:MAG: hypothetical protein GX751_07950 [Desulfuromonadaceae bacterium]|nr:hypothetical protein [Desulfuromonadaceae bacterium]